MSSVVRAHPWNLRGLRLRLLGFLLRFAVTPLWWLNNRYRRARPGVDLKTLHVPSRDPGRTIVVDLYYPAGSQQKKLPVHINWHGSGFLIPSLGSDHEFVKQGVVATGGIFADADYRKSPNNPFPAQTNDAEDVVAYFLSKPDVYDVSKITVGGFSAGGNLALGVSTTFGPERIRAVTSIYPAVSMIGGLGNEPPPSTQSRSGFPLPRWLRNLFVDCYILPGTDRSDPRISPLSGPTSAFPKHVLLACGDADTLFARGKELVEKISRAEPEKQAVFLHYKDEGHAFDKFPRHPESRRLTEQLYARAFETIRTSWA